MNNKFLLDTHLLLWIVANKPATITKKLKALLLDSTNMIYFSPITIWEVAIKHALNRPDFSVDPHMLRRTLIADGYLELPLTSAHTLGMVNLPPHHKDPFDRMLIAQATVAGMVLLTHDKIIAAYTGYPIRYIA